MATDATTHLCHDSVAEWQEWMRTKDDKKRLGHNVSKKIRQLVKERIEKVASENERLQEEHKELREVREACKRMGYTVGGYGADVQARLDIIRKKFCGSHLKDRLEKSRSYINRGLGDAIDTLRILASDKRVTRDDQKENER